MEKTKYSQYMLKLNYNFQTILHSILDLTLSAYQPLKVQSFLMLIFITKSEYFLLFLTKT